MSDPAASARREQAAHPAAGKFHVLVADPLHEDGCQLLEAAGDVRFTGPVADRQALLQTLQTIDALIVRSRTQVDAELLAAAPQLQVVARAGSRLNNVDLDAATHRGILVLHAPEANLIAVAEHTFAMLLALARRLPAAFQAIHDGEWPRHELLGWELHGKTLGVIGFGRLGQAVAQRAQAFGMPVLAYDPLIDLAQARQQGVEVVDFNELLARADVISLHTDLSPSTAGLIDAAALRRMKPGAVLVNCTLAGLVDEGALLAALDSGHLAGAVIDTFQEEPPDPHHPLLHHPRVVAAPHLNQNTYEAQSATSQQVVQDVLAALRGEDYRHIVNLPFNDHTPYQQIKPYIHLAAKLGKLQGQLAEGWIQRVEVEVLGEGMRSLVRPVAAVLLSGMIRSQGERAPNWVSAPALAYEQGVQMAQAKGLVSLADYPNLLACRIYWRRPNSAPGSRTVAGVLFGNGEARLVQYDGFQVDAYPEGYMLVLENDDLPGVIGKVGTRLGRAGINIAQWRYGREARGGRAVSFINLDQKPPRSLLAELESEAEIRRARLVRL